MREKKIETHIISLQNFLFFFCFFSFQWLLFAVVSLCAAVAAIRWHIDCAVLFRLLHHRFCLCFVKRILFPVHTMRRWSDILYECRFALISEVKSKLIWNQPNDGCIVCVSDAWKSCRIWARGIKVKRIKQSTVTVSGFYLLYILRADAFPSCIEKPTRNQIMCVYSSSSLYFLFLSVCETSDLNAHKKRLKSSLPRRTKRKFPFQWKRSLIISNRNGPMLQIPFSIYISSVR